MTRTPGICRGHTDLEPSARPHAEDAAARLTTGVVGWDIGGVNTKIARIPLGPPLWSAGPTSDVQPPSIVASVRPFEIQRDPLALTATLRELADAVGVLDSDVHAVTMTAELSQMFRRKRAGVSFVLDAVTAAFPDTDLGVYTTHGVFLSPAAAREQPLAVAAANWTATARVLAAVFRTAVIVDIGTTTTDVIPVVDGELLAEGWTDPDRLQSGELLYLGAVRTPVEAITQVVPVPSGEAGVSAEGFALSGDVHVWRGTLRPSEYTTPTPDGRPVTREYVGERLARVVCADREWLDDAAIDRIADAVAAAQIRRTADAITRVCARHPGMRTAVVTGVGDFVAAAAASQLGLSVRTLADAWGPDAAHAAPAAAVAFLRAQRLATGDGTPAPIIELP
jgi:(4-(4-[2-(gamma-L-glutamylamino)ethyl]phenoxymethyl)furan-2-yl)methanamine synthase